MFLDSWFGSPIHSKDILLPFSYEPTSLHFLRHLGHRLLDGAADHGADLFSSDVPVRGSLFGFLSRSGRRSRTPTHGGSGCWPRQPSHRVACCSGRRLAPCRPRHLGKEKHNVIVVKNSVRLCVYSPDHVHNNPFALHREMDSISPQHTCRVITVNHRYR